MDGDVVAAVVQVADKLQSGDHVEFRIQLVFGQDPEIVDSNVRAHPVRRARIGVSAPVRAENAGDMRSVVVDRRGIHVDLDKGLDEFPVQRPSRGQIVRELIQHLLRPGGDRRVLQVSALEKLGQAARLRCGISVLRENAAVVQIHNALIAAEIERGLDAAFAVRDEGGVVATDAGVDDCPGNRRAVDLEQIPGGIGLHRRDRAGQCG
ncbi:hypothetical protein AJ87_14965 [Rhizobium yanglingense]|nr:hypothetical protein AJ87_14965 [Rhizobium yanglingense]